MVCFPNLSSIMVSQSNVYAAVLLKTCFIFSLLKPLGEKLTSPRVMESAHTYTHTHTYIYIYIYIDEREDKRKIETIQEKLAIGRIVHEPYIQKDSIWYVQYVTYVYDL